MAFSRVQYTQSVPGNKSFVIPFPYLQRPNIQVSDEGVVVTYSFVDAQTVLLDVAPDVGAVVDIRRITPSEILVDYTDGSTLTELELDTTYRQSLFLAQEAIDTAFDALQLDTDGAYNALGHRIKNLGTPVNSTDAANKAYVDSVIDSINSLISVIQGYVADAEAAAVEAAGSAQGAEDQAAIATAQAALATAQVALAEAQVALATAQAEAAEGFADAAAGHAADAAGQVALAAAQVAIAAGHAADAAASQAAAEAAQTASEAAAAAAAASAVEATANGAAAGAAAGEAAAEDIVQDYIDSGTLGGYPGVSDNDPINQDMRRAWAALSATESDTAGGFTGLMNGNDKAILTPGLSHTIGKRIPIGYNVSPARIGWVESPTPRWVYVTHSAPSTLVNLNQDADGRPILLVPGTSDNVLVLGQTYSEVMVLSSLVGSSVDVPGYTKLAWSRLVTMPTDNSGSAEVYHSLLYDAIVNGSKFLSPFGGAEFFECYQEVTVEYQNDLDPTDVILRKWIRHVLPSGFAGDEWQPVGGSGGGTGVFPILESTDGELRINNDLAPGSYFDFLTSGPTSNGTSLAVSDSNGNTYSAFGGNGDGTYFSTYGISQSSVTRKQLVVTAIPGVDTGDIYINNQQSSGSSSNLRLSLNVGSTNVSTVSRTKNKQSGSSDAIITSISSSDLTAPSSVEVRLAPHTNSTFNSEEYVKIGTYNGLAVNSSTIGAYSAYKSQPSNASRPAKSYHYTMRNSANSLLMSGFSSGVFSSQDNYVFSTDVLPAHAKMIVSRSSNSSEAEVGVRTLGTDISKAEAYVQATRFRVVTVPGALTDGTNEFFCIGSAPAASNFTTPGIYRNGLQGTGICIFNAGSSTVGVRLSSRFSSGNTAVGVFCSDHAGAPGEVAGVTPLRFEQDLTSGGVTRVWTAANTTIGTDAQNPSAFNDGAKTLTSITRMGNNRKMITIRQRSLTPDINGIITLTLPESYKNLISASFTQDQPDLLDLSSSSMYIPNSFSMSSATSRSTVSLGFLEIDGGIVAIAISAGDCAGLITLVVEE